MSTLLFRLKDVPDDEADDIRKLLTENIIEFYETSAGNWGISLAGIWIKDETQLTQAKALIKEYENNRLTKARAEYNERFKDGNERTVIDVVKENPFRFLLYMAVIVLILTLSIKPFLDLAHS